MTPKERTWGKKKLLEDGKTSHVHRLEEYHLNGYANKSDLQIRCSPYIKISKTLFIELEKKS